ncbi:MAG: hypothetical protein J2P37_35265 [Ktedonobacteraceae bacterium]|nr:hypothetical protein [Ktedonobacteraceae bacterium]MBO0795944.1 hypothetical protein [Ktedonobacteraceae bacterium]
MAKRQVWHYLVPVFALIWIGFASVLIFGDVPFLAISIALTALAAMSTVVIALAWAFQNDI